MVSKHKYMGMALVLASLSDHRFKHGAVLVKRGKIVGEGYNTYTKSGHGSLQKSVHAEVNALESSSRLRLRDMRGAVMYVGRVASYGTAMSRPCTRCECCMRGWGIVKVIFTTAIGEVDHIDL
jgi:deoxycytidylate deaminase